MPAMAAGIDGKWNATVDSPMGAIPVALEFKSEGEKLTGTIATRHGRAGDAAHRPFPMVW